MTFKEKVKDLLGKALEENPQLFLIDLDFSETNKISVVLDGDSGVNLQDCINVNKFLDNGLEGEEVEFSIEVASAGLSTPLKLVRQYKKNIGRTLKVKTISQGDFEGTLTEADEDGATLTWNAREPKEIGKGKVTVEKTLKISYTDIKEAVVIISF
ncbi:ribosome assembly cofactor RimP [Flavobacterium terrigena]|uniref:Ribosome maturation factor RimP n=1 Tax=Flavobacterium terrigena TaxID=402734 RepID=A0A1H6VBI6_9FLAO|nr:ribosome assembly cofactor RimP [Flavobacterium terrigena]SEJ00344.1 ribosome maturation factor RimP [Flavobacterium terrigena]